MRPRLVSLFLTLALLTPSYATAGPATKPDFTYNQYVDALMSNLTHSNPDIQKQALSELARLKEPRAISSLIDLLAVNAPLSDAIPATLAAITGKDFGADWQVWAAWAGALTLPQYENYGDFKRALLYSIDPAFRAFALGEGELTAPLRDLYPSGARKDEAPALVSPSVVSRRQAVFVDDDDVVYGIALDGHARAYPARIVDWHLIVNDVLGRRPFVLVTCPLSGLLSAYGAYAGRKTFTFGLSGLVYQNSIVLYDHQNTRLWSIFNGETLSAREGEETLALEKISVVRTSWKDWRTRFPDTTVLDENTGYRRNYRTPSPYFLASVADENAFPVSGRLGRAGVKHNREIIYGIRIGNRAKAYPLGYLGGKEVVNDALHGVNLVLVADQATGSIQAFERSSYRFRRAAASALEDESGGLWQVKENGLVAEQTQETLPEIPGQRAFFSSWITWHPESERAHAATAGS